MRLYSSGIWEFLSSCFEKRAIGCFLIAGRHLNGLGIVKKEQQIGQTIHEDSTIFG
jgi:hypothetical protein